jgi:transposase
VLAERTWVGLDVHARSVVGCAIDDEACEIHTQPVAPQTDAVVAWVLALPGPVAVTYEAGPTGFGLARALAAVGVRCEVVAPSKLERRPGTRSRPIAGTLSDWRGCCASGSCPRCGFPSEARSLSGYAVRDLRARRLTLSR